ncbi:MAG: hypothetical protein HQK54_03020 [Oligoflexales bacterium]|nr:hypothetical protein [Oligoflexales bacterium]
MKRAFGQSFILSIQFLFLTLFLENAPLSGDEAENTLCLGPAGAKIKFIYLHGFDDPGVGGQEKENRRIMQRLTEKYGFRIAIPRGNGMCRGGTQKCWAISSDKEVSDTYRYILEKTKTCLEGHDSFGILGFSNGGYFLAKLYDSCPAPRARWLVTTGSAGKAPEVLSKDCPPLHLLIGKKDLAFKKTKNLYESLKSKKAKVAFESFDGGHVINEEAVAKAISNINEKS